MRGRFLAWLVATTCAIALAVTFSGCTTILGSFDVAPAGTASGATCDAGAQCGTGFCSDGVCCEATCDGVCEACNVPGSVGKCTPIPDGENPANECPTTPLPPEGEEDAGTPIDLDAGDAGDDAGVNDAGVAFAPPDGGVERNDGQCGGVCNGQRACRFPGTERTCGTTFCATPTEQARAACDGAGHCTVGSDRCEAYSCADGSPGCKQSCTGEADCASTHFCDALSSTCKPKLGNGSACNSLAQCQDAHCVSGVCCNDECTTIPGGSCTSPGHIGECRCAECTTGTCQLFYRDADGDGYGNKNGTIAAGTAKPGCVAAPPVGFVADNTDCFDDASRPISAQVHPGQSTYFAAAYDTGSGTSYDYDCDGSLAKETPEYPGGTCGFCRVGRIGALCSQSTTCATVGEKAGFGCTFGFGVCPKGCSRCSTTAMDGAFTVNRACGETGTPIDCGDCNGTGVAGTTVLASRPQRCR